MNQICENNDTWRNIVDFHKIQELESFMKFSRKSENFHHNSEGDFVWNHIFHHSELITSDSHLEILLSRTRIKVQVDHTDVDLNFCFDHRFHLLQSLGFSSILAKSFDNSGVGNQICSENAINFSEQAQGTSDILHFHHNIQSTVESNDHSWKIGVFLDSFEKVQSFLISSGFDKSFDYSGEDD